MDIDTQRNHESFIRARHQWIGQLIEEFAIAHPPKNTPGSVSEWLALMDAELAVHDSGHHIELEHFTIRYLGHSEYLYGSPILLHVTDRQEEEEHIFAGRIGRDGFGCDYSAVPVNMQ